MIANEMNHIRDESVDHNNKIPRLYINEIYFF